MVKEIHTEAWDGHQWIEYQFEHTIAESLGMSASEWREKGAWRARYLIRKTSWMALAHENLSSNIDDNDMPLIFQSQQRAAFTWDALEADESLREAARKASIDDLLDTVCALGIEKGLEIHNLVFALNTRDYACRAPSRSHHTILALEKQGWECLTGICDSTDDGKTERRLMRDPIGDFHIVSERIDPERGIWETTTETITPARARYFYIEHCIPTSLAREFTEHESPALRLISAHGETEALMQLLAAYATAKDVRGDSERARMQAGLDRLINGVAARVRDAQEAT